MNDQSVSTEFQPVTITAKEVRSGMLVRVTRHFPATGCAGAYSRTYQGVVKSKDPDIDIGWYFESPDMPGGEEWFQVTSPEHPVTVLAASPVRFNEGMYYARERRFRHTHSPDQPLDAMEGDVWEQAEPGDPAITYHVVERIVYEVESIEFNGAESKS